MPFSIIVIKILIKYETLWLDSTGKTKIHPEAEKPTSFTVFWPVLGLDGSKKGPIPKFIFSCAGHF